MALIRCFVCSFAVGTALLSVPLGAQQFPPVLPSRAESFISKQDAELLPIYQARLVQVVEQIPDRVTLAALVRPLLQFAAERSATGSPTAENRVAILAIAFYLNAEPLAMFFPETRTWPRPRSRQFVLLGRDDLAKHFIVSAAASAAAGVPAADALGLYKEFSDARGGSGFSFADLAADRAGTVFGQTATSSVDSAREVHSRLAVELAETDMMPSIVGLPENLTDAEFTRRYRGASAPAYDALLKEIDARIAALRLYQRPGVPTQ